MLTKDSETPDDIGIPAAVVDAIPELVCGYHLALLRPRADRVDSVYLAKQLASSETARRFARLASGSTRYGLSYAAIASTPVRLRPLPQQRRIAEILSTVDEAIEQTEKLIAKHQQIKSGLMNDLFTRGLTPDGRLRPPHNEAPHLYKDSPLGPIPKEWEIHRVKAQGSVKLGRQRAPRFETRSSGTPYLRVANVFDGWIDYSDVYSMFFSKSEQVEYSLIAGDILLNEGQSKELVGRSAKYAGPPNAFCFQNTLIRFRPNERALSDYFQAVFKCYLDRGWFAAVAHQTTSVAHLGANRFARMFIPKPSQNEALQISWALHQAQVSIDGQTEGAQKLRLLRCGLMHDLLTGNVPAVNGSKGFESGGSQ